MQRILITGAEGQVGWELKNLLGRSGDVRAIDKEQLDLTDADAIRTFIRAFRPHILINPAAYTAVDKAESSEDVAMAINGTSPGILAEEMKRLGGVIVHYSTDYVFDGNKSSPWTEDDLPRPLNAYGRSKLAGERAVKSVGGHHLILRTSWVYGRRGSNFMLTMIRLAKEREELSVVADQRGAPTWSRSLGVATVRILARFVEERDGSLCVRSDLSGLYHLTAGGVTSWHGFAESIVHMAPELKDRRHVRVRGITTRQYPTPAVRPLNSVLDNSKVARVFGIVQEPWISSLAACLPDSPL